MSWSMMLLLSISITVSIVHSHHHLQWNHPEEMADTGHCLTEDAAICPICGYLLKTDLPAPTVNGSAFITSEIFSVDTEVFTPTVFEIVVKGRSPPTFS